MDKKLQSFLSSGAIDRYIAGIANHTEKAEAEYFIENFTEAKELYLKLQTQLEINDALKAEEAPSHLLSKIIDEIEPSYPKNQNQFFVNYEIFLIIHYNHNRSLKNFLMYDLCVIEHIYSFQV